MIAGDYKAFDKTMSPVFMKYAFEIIIRLCLDSGNFTYEDSKYMRAMYVDIIYPLSIYKGDLVRFFGSNPSGHPLTVIINGLVNSLYIRYVYRLCNPNHTVSDFKDNVCLMTYGDDNIMSVNKNITWFNHTIISKTLNTMGITYTMADKVSESKPFIDIEDCTFLKRSWRWDTDLKAYVGPLDHESIEKMLMVHVRSKTVHPEEQTIDGVSSALREYFFYGKSVYNDKLELLKKVVEKSGLNSFVKRTTFVAWEVLRDKFVENSNIYDYIYEERPLINIDENEYRLQSDHSIIPMDIHRKILLMELPARKVNDQYIYQSCYLGEYYKASWMLGMNLVHYNRHIYMSNMIGNNTFFPEGEFLNLNQWRSIHYPRPHVQSISWFTKICYFIWIALIIVWYGIIILFMMSFGRFYFGVQAGIMEEDIENIFNFPNSLSTGNHVMPWQLTNIFFITFQTIAETICSMVLGNYMSKLCMEAYSCLSFIFRISARYQLVHLIVILIISNVMVGVLKMPLFIILIIVKRQIFRFQ
jgi:hypothetical protein